MRQLSLAVMAYAQDYDDQVWPQFEWVPIGYSIAAAAAITCFAKSAT